MGAMYGFDEPVVDVGVLGAAGSALARGAVSVLTNHSSLADTEGRPGSEAPFFLIRTCLCPGGHNRRIRLGTAFELVQTMAGASQSR